MSQTEKDLLAMTESKCPEMYVEVIAAERSQVCNEMRHCSTLESYLLPIPKDAEH